MSLPDNGEQPIIIGISPIALEQLAELRRKPPSGWTCIADNIEAQIETHIAAWTPRSERGGTIIKWCEAISLHCNTDIYRLKATGGNGSMARLLFPSGPGQATDSSRSGDRRAQGQSSVLRGHDPTTREAAPSLDGSVQECGQAAPDASLQLTVARLGTNESAAYKLAIERIEAAWAADFEAGRLTPLAYYRRLRHLPLDYVEYRTGISLDELFAIDDGPALPTPEQAAQLAAILGVDASILIKL